MKLIKIIIWIFFTTVVHTQGMYSIIDIPYSARTIGLSGSGTSSEIYSISNNPSSIKTDKIIFGAHSIFLPLDINYQRFEAIISKNKNIFFSEIKNINFGEFNDGLTNITFKAREISIKVGLKKPILDTFSTSFSLDYIYSYISDYTSQGIFGSLGFRTETFNKINGFSFSIENYGIIIDGYRDNVDKINPKYRLSAYHKLLYAPAILNFDLINGTHTKALLASSIEIYIKEIILTRFGIESIINKNYNQNRYHFSFGIGINYKKYILDFGMKNMGNLGLLSGISVHYIML